MLRWPVIGLLNDDHSMAVFGEGFRAHACAASAAHDDDIRLEDFRLVARRDLDELVLESFGWLAVNWHAGEG